LRGILYTQIEVTGPAQDLHSGHFGGAVQNPANALCAIIAALKDGDGRITVPGFYDKLRKIEAKERDMLRAAPFDEQAYLKESGAPQPFGETGYTTLERITVRPTLQETHDLPCILMGFGLDDDNVHAPNEKFSLSSFRGGTNSVAYLYEELAAVVPAMR